MKTREKEQLFLLEKFNHEDKGRGLNKRFIILFNPFYCVDNLDLYKRN